MGMLSRMSTIVKSKMNRILDSAENPNETLDFAYEKQLEMLRGVKRGVVEMVAAKRRIQQQATSLQANVTRLSEQAGQAMEAGREDLARLALQRKQVAVIELQGLDEQ
ncbi:MAG TPA: PspA/IM30 family protein, partial [Dehalococcoidia bacterium]|nr:PspA/IM30 family protein [Dehalococcoidia bacterium]